MVQRRWQPFAMATTATGMTTTSSAISTGNILTRIINILVVTFSLAAINSVQSSHLQNAERRWSNGRQSDSGSGGTGVLLADHTAYLHPGTECPLTVRKKSRDTIKPKTYVHGDSRRWSHRRRLGTIFSPWAPWSLCNHRCKQERTRHCKVRRKCGEVKHTEERTCQNSVCTKRNAISRHAFYNSDNDALPEVLVPPPQYGGGGDDDFDERDYFVFRKTKTPSPKNSNSKRRKKPAANVNDDDFYVDAHVSEQRQRRPQYDDDDDDDDQDGYDDFTSADRKVDTNTDTDTVQNVTRLLSLDNYFADIGRPRIPANHRPNGVRATTTEASVDLSYGRIFDAASFAATRHPSLRTGFVMDDEQQEQQQQQQQPAQHEHPWWQQTNDYTDRLKGGRRRMAKRFFEQSPEEVAAASRRRIGGAGREKAVFEVPRRTKRVYTKWSKWSDCSEKCTTRRFKRCKIKETCGKEVVRDIAWCYVEGSFCQQWIQEKMQSTNTEKPTNAEAKFTNAEVAAVAPVARTNTVSDARTGKSQALSTRDWQCGEPEVRGKGKGQSTWNMLRIIGGRTARRGQWPWQVAVLNRFKEAFCGGTLIAPHWVLTAAHCVRKRLYVRLGEHNLEVEDGTELELRVRSAIKHPKYDKNTVDSDLAMLRLPTEISTSTYVGFACLPQRHQALPFGSQCTIIGWGKRRNSDDDGTNVLHEAEVPIISTDECRSVYTDLTITKNMFCAGHKRGRIDTCAGDSGGPLLCRDATKANQPWTIFGITSFGDGCGKRNKFGIYTKMPNYVDWVWSVVRCNGTC